MAEKESVLQEAERLIHGERREAYGGMKLSFVMWAELWDAYLRNRPGGYGEGVKPRDVAALMILLKIGRVAYSDKRDNWTDTAGYAGIGAVLDGHDDEYPEGGC